MWEEGITFVTIMIIIIITDNLFHIPLNLKRKCVVNFHHSRKISIIYFRYWYIFDEVEKKQKRIENCFRIILFLRITSYVRTYIHSYVITMANFSFNIFSLCWRCFKFFMRFLNLLAKEFSSFMFLGEKNHQV